MPSIDDIKISKNLSLVVKTDEAAVGPEITLSPDGFILPGVAKWVDRSGGILIGYPAFTLSVRNPTRDSRVTRVVAKLVIPTLEQTSASTMTGIQPAPTKAYDLIANMEFVIPDRSSLTEREDFLSKVVSLLSKTVTASDDDPSVLTKSPLVPAILTQEAPY